MFQEFYNLRDQPFGVTPDPRYLYFSEAHREALSSLLYGIETDQGFVALIAQPGMGKTTLLFRLHELLGDSALTAFVFQTQCTSWEFIRYIAADLGITVRAGGSGVLIEQIYELLIHEANEGRRVVLVIDEAQNLDNSVLETIRMLSNFETPKAKLLQIVLAGQPQLAHKLMSPHLVQLRQRISTLTRLCPLKSNEIVEYIDHRLSVAGHSGPSLFSVDAISLIDESSGGIPRSINTICFNALSLGYAKGQKLISRSTVQEVVSDLDFCLLVPRGLAGKGAPGKETQLDPNGDKRAINLSTPGNAPPDALALSLQSMSRFFRWKVDASVCVLFFVVYLMTWFASPVSRANVPSAKVSRDHSITARLPGQERTMAFTVVVKPNDTLSEICRLYLGEFNPSVAEKIRRLNPGLSNLDFLQIGQQILLPFSPQSRMSRSP